MLFLSVTCFSFFQQISKHLSKQQRTHDLDNLIGHLTDFHLVLHVIEDVVDSVKMHVKLKASSQVILHFFENKCHKLGTNFFYHFDESLTRFVSSV
jgi:hypothetical protein